MIDKLRDMLKTELTGLIKDDGFCFKREDFDKLRQPSVYIALKDGVALYVGMSRRGIVRPTSHHKQLNDIDYDEIHLYPVTTPGAALRLERLLIEALKPSYNINRPVEIGHKVLGIGREQYRVMRKQLGR